MKEADKMLRRASLAERNTRLTRDVLKHAHLVTADATEQVAALVTAATVLIEQQVGRTMAPAALLALVQPTIDDWQRHAEGRA